MKIKLLAHFSLFLISTTLAAQVESVELFPELINTPGLQNSWPSMNNSMDRLCFLQSGKKGDGTRIMVSDKSGNGQWTQPYAAYKLGKSEFALGASMNSTGAQIYVGMNNDIWMIEYLGGTSWSKPVRINTNVSSPNVMEGLPSISRDNQFLTFIRSTRVRSLRTGEYKWLFVPFISKRLANNEWGTPQKINTKSGDGEEVHALHYDSEQRKLFFSTGSTRNDYSNYYATLNDSICVDVKKIDFTGGYITWVSNDFETGLTVTATSPIKIASIKFGSAIAGEVIAKREEVVSIRDPVPQVLQEEAPLRSLGKYYALLIGVSQYNESSLNLDKPGKDVQRFKEVLCSSYEFETENVKVLTDPSRQEIIRELYKFRSKIKPEDNLLIFFAGHGYWDDQVKQGYWWPKDAHKSDPSFWLSNSDLREQIKGINSRHTLLISDACFSGGIFKARGVDDLRTASIEIKILYKTKSRRAITSGNLSTVPDQSVFFDYLLKRLAENNEKYISSQLLFSSLKLAVINNSLTIPQEGVINDAGDEGGDFIFIKREK